MGWYYSLPDLLLAIQIAVSFYTFLTLIPYKAVRLVLCGTALFFYMGKVGSDVIGGSYWMNAYLENTERERREIGVYIGNTLGDTDSLMSNHGLVARHVKGYVIDMSGLNSKFATSYKLDPEAMIHAHHPGWGINHTSPAYAEMMARLGYAPFRTFYDITNYSYPEWTLFKRMDDKNAWVNYQPLDSTKIKNANTVLEGQVWRYESDSLTLLLNDSLNKLKTIRFGIRRQVSPFTLVLVQTDKNGQLKNQEVEIKPLAEYPLDSKYTQALVLERNGDGISKINIFAGQKGIRFTIIDPFVESKN